MKLTLVRLTALLGSAAIATAAQAQTYDLVIENGRVMDPETLYDSVANVGISNGRIAVITKMEISGTRTIDAANLVVAPGFIDTHFHSVDPLATKLVVADGVTSGMGLEAGASSVGAWYDTKAKRGWQINYGTTSGWNFSRLLVHDSEVEVNEPFDASNAGGYVNKSAEDGVQGWSLTRSNIKQMNQLSKLADEDLRQGALGIAFATAYSARGTTSYEQFEAQRTVARYGRLSSVHTRFHLNTNPPSEAAIGLDEVLVNAMLLDAPLLMAHNNDYGWWEIEEKLQMAREQGHNVRSEYYPFTAASALISADFLQPALWEDQLGYKYEETIYDPGTDKFLSKDEFLTIVADNPGYFVVIFFPTREAWLPFWPKIPHMVVASDAMQGVDTAGNLLPYDADNSLYAGHPRTSSSFSTTLALAREAEVMDWMPLLSVHI